jgi:hypothetical protein
LLDVNPRLFIVVVSPIGTCVKTGVVVVAAVEDPVAPPPSMEAYNHLFLLLAVVEGLD